jgi:NAD(P)-dependent dehydrogenase (short-subunit alcohol dehydrogenase family)
VSPGPIATPIFGKIGLSEQQAQEFGASIVQSVPMGRTGTPEEIASAVLFLASNESSYVSGIELAVDGGMAQV